MNKKVINIGLIGFGTVGTGVVKVLKHSPETFTEKTGLRPVIKRIVDIDIKRRRNIRIPAEILSKNVKDILSNSEIDVVIELTGNESAAKQIILNAISKGKNIVTANKAALARYWDEIFTAARKNGVGVYYEAAVCAGIPVIQVLQQGLAANHISQIFGIVNGTTNYILTRMSRDACNFREALTEAQREGFAESNPTLDIKGYDSLHKIVILASLAFGKRVKTEDVYVEGIDKTEVRDIEYGIDLGYVLKLLAIAKETNGKIEVRVHPTFLPKEHLLSSVENEFNAVYIVGDLAGPIVMYGRGAGQMAAASAVVGDLIYLGRNLASGTGTRISNITWKEKHPDLKIKEINEVKSRYYLRFSVVDSPGVLAKISNILGRNNISIAQVLQKSRSSRNIVPVVMMTHEAIEKNIQHALKLIDRLDIVKAKTVLIRIEEGE